MHVDIIIGDFNLKPDQFPNDSFVNYEHIVLEPTHLRGAILDQGYIHKKLKKIFNFHVNIKSIFFSDDEAVRISLQRKV